MSSSIGKLLHRLRKWHKWPGLVFTVFILLFAISGIILNHRDLLSSIDVSRNLLPHAYRYRNWNLAAIKGSKPWKEDSILVYGNMGVWITDTSFRTFSDFNAGFPEGIDNRKISAISVSETTGIHAATLFGLYRFYPEKRRWLKVVLPVREERIAKVLTKGDSLLVLTRSNLLVSGVEKGMDQFTVIRVPAGYGDDGKTSLFRTLWVIHSGEIYGITGKLIVDAVGIIFMILCITGLIYFFVPYRLNRLNEEFRRIRLKRFTRNSLRWHNSVGSWAILLLILTTLTGMFLRPPLLIPIAGSRIGKIPYTELSDPNPWFDRFRDLLWDPAGRRWLVATSEGIYEAEEEFTSPLKPFAVQPPVSVMGITVFEQPGPCEFLVGSFSGIFLWNPEEKKVTNYITRLPYRSHGRGSPFGDLSVAGYLRVCPIPGPSPLVTSEAKQQNRGIKEVLFDYQGGAITLTGGNWFPAMPQDPIQKSPISLWNFALEVHTGRIFQPILGDFYILVVPVVGLAALEISVVGFLAWWVIRRRQRSRLPDPRSPVIPPPVPSGFYRHPLP